VKLITDTDLVPGPECMAISLQTSVGLHDLRPRLCMISLPALTVSIENIIRVSGPKISIGNSYGWIMNSLLRGGFRRT
jgi:hypothetical protein